MRVLGMPCLVFSTTVRGLLAVLAGAALAGPAQATLPDEPFVIASQAAPARATRTKPAAAEPAPATAPVVVSGTAPGQAGYIHYFVITGPDGEPESHVGIEMPDQRIAWSFPELGVTISRFIRRGAVFANGRSYDVEYLYGLKPMRDEQRMRALQTALPKRVEWWINNKTPYCTEELTARGLCVSCLGFVLRVLYPGATPALPALPADFQSMRKSVYTTEDLLLYLAGVRVDEPREARLKRIAALPVPDTMREELVRIAEIEIAADVAATGDSAPATQAKPRASRRAMVPPPKRATPPRS